MEDAGEAAVVVDTAGTAAVVEGIGAVVGDESQYVKGCLARSNDVKDLNVPEAAAVAPGLSQGLGGEAITTDYVNWKMAEMEDRM